jgi:hypothetical protein
VFSLQNLCAAGWSRVFHGIPRLGTPVVGSLAFIGKTTGVYLPNDLRIEALLR